MSRPGDSASPGGARPGPGSARVCGSWLWSAPGGPLTSIHHTVPQDEVRTALKASASSFLFAGLFSLFINLLLLVPALYMLQVYDRVLPSGSESTLVMLTVLVVWLFTLMGVLELLRSRILVRVSGRLDQGLNGRLFRAMFDATLVGGRGHGTQPVPGSGHLAPIPDRQRAARLLRCPLDAGLHGRAVLYSPPHRLALPGRGAGARGPGVIE